MHVSMGGEVRIVCVSEGKNIIIRNDRLKENNSWGDCLLWK